LLARNRQPPRHQLTGELLARRPHGIKLLASRLFLSLNPFAFLPQFVSRIIDRPLQSQLEVAQRSAGALRLSDRSQQHQADGRPRHDM
jgi:hypothetical protein